MIERCIMLINLCDAPVPRSRVHPCRSGTGGRVSGAEVIAELITELHASVQQAQQFEGEMQMLAEYAG